MSRKTARMLRKGMIITINGRSRVITDIQREIDDNNDTHIIITCGNESFKRTAGAKIEVIGRNN